MPEVFHSAGSQRRALIAVTLVNTIGNGLYSTAGVLYFTRAIHLSAAQVGLGLGIAGFATIAIGVPIGHLADRQGPRGVYAATLLCGAIAMAGFAVARNFWSFLLMACIGGIAQAGGSAARAPIIRSLGGDRPQEFRARLRSVANLGIAVGGLLAGWAAETDTFTAYLALILGDGFSFLIASAIILLLPAVDPEPLTEGPRWAALRDRPYIMLTLIDSVLSIQLYVLTIAIPLWITDSTSVPRWFISAVVFINTAIVVIFQVRASRNIDNATTGGYALRRAGFGLFASMAVISFANHASALTAGILIAIAIVIQSISELWYSAGGFELSYGLAPSSLQGQYLGVFGMGVGLAGSFGPALLTTLCIGWGRPGWYVLGLLFVAAGLGAPFTVRWAENNRVIS